MLTPADSASDVAGVAGFGAGLADGACCSAFLLDQFLMPSIVLNSWVLYRPPWVLSTAMPARSSFFAA